MDDTGEDHVFRVSIEFSAESYRKIDVSVAFLSDDMVTPVGKRTLSDYRFHSRGYRESDPATQTFTLPSEAAEFVEDTLAAYVAANAPAEQAEQERSAEPGFFGRLFGR